MSSCVIIAQKDKLYIGADSACSIKTQNGFARYCNDMQKLFRFGNQVLFCSGKTSDVSDCIKWIELNMSNNIDVDILSYYLQNRFKNVFYDKYFNIEMLIVDYDTKYIYQLSQYNNFEILKYKSTEQLFVLCGGYKTLDFFNKIKNNILSKRSVMETYVNTYKDMCDECVGGYVTIYSSPNNFEKYSIDYIDIDVVRDANNLFLVSSDFVTAGFVSGSQIIGGNIYSDNYSITDATGSYLNLRDGTFSFGGGSLKFDGDKLIISSNAADTNITELNDEWLKTTEVYAEKLTVNAANVNGQLTAAEIDAGQITSGTISADRIDMTGAIAWDDLNSNVQQSINSAQRAAEDAYDMASSTQSTLNQIAPYTYDGNTYIDGTKIMSGTVKASILQGGIVQLLDMYENNCGSITITSAETGDYAFDLRSNAAMRLTSSQGSLFLQGGVDVGFGNYINLTSGNFIYIGNSYGVGIFAPATDNSFDCGFLENRWKDIYTVDIHTVNAPIQTSDATKKKNIDYDLSKYEDFYINLKPISYQFIDNQSERTHIGFVSQDVEKALNDVGITSQEFAGFIKTPIINEETNETVDYSYGLRYGEFIALNTHMIQKLYQRISELESKIIELQN